MLHVTNGRAAMLALTAAGIEGPILPWDDVLHDGPVPRADDAVLRRTRAAFLASRGWTTVEEAERALRERDETLAAAGEHEEVVLWFEPDLYDQLQLIDVLRRLDAVGHARVTIADTGTYIGPAQPAVLARALAERAPATRASFELARTAWDAFTATTPEGVAALAAQGTPALPHLAAALLRLLEEYPATADGLSRTERQLLEVLSEEPLPIKDAYVRAHHAREDPIWLGDLSFAAIVAALAATPEPVVFFDGPAPQDIDRVMHTRVALAPLGERILAGRADRVRDCGIDRWLGGVHLSGTEVEWRWDIERATLVHA